MFNLIKYLSKNNEITLVCEKRSNQDNSDINEIKRYCKEVFTVDRKSQWSVGNILKSGFSTSPFLLTGHKLQEMQNLISLQIDSNIFAS